MTPEGGQAPGPGPGGVRCPSCGHGNPSDARFCDRCGSELGAVCDSCGTRNSPGARFCRRCGARLGAGGPAPASSVSGSAATSPRSVEGLSAVAAGRYRIRRFLGEGGRKRVWLAHDGRLDREVALAVIKTEGLDEAGLVRVRREAQAMGRLGDHPNVVTVYDIGEEDGRTFIVSQYMSGGSVADLLKRAEGHRLPVEDVVRIGVEICRALEHAHTRGIVHRDLKPGNVWLGEDGSAKLGDFGLAVALDRSRLTMEGMMVGTVAYMPPEQALGRDVDARSDLYALGAMLYEMTTGRPPFLGDDAVAVISQHINMAPVAPSWHNPQVPRPLEDLILRLLAKDPAKRPGGAAEVREALSAITPAASSAGERIAEEANPLDRLASGVFVGREAEMVELKAQLDDALSGRARLVMLVGEPGIGKTRTADELATYAALRGAQVLWGRCYEGEGAPAYWPWVQIIRSYVHDRDPKTLVSEMGPGAADIAQVVSEVRDRLPGLPEPPALDPDSARFRLFDSVSTFLRNATRSRPLVLVIDDLHWADQPSLRLLHFLAREVREARLLVVGTYRDVELRRDHPLQATLAELNREQLHRRINLRGLTEEDVARYIRMTAGVEPRPALVAKIYEETEGNPFFVSEVVRLLTSEGTLAREEDSGTWSIAIPQGVREVVGRRLNLVSEDCNRLLAVASVVGRDFSLNVLEAVGDLSVDRLLEVLEEAVRSRLVAEVPGSLGRYRFSHALIRETLYEELSSPRRVRLHRQVGEVLEALYGPSGPHLTELAHHFFEAAPAGGVARAIEYAVRAGERASSLLAYEEAAGHYERALQALELRGADDSMRCDLLLGLGDARWGAGEATRARETFQGAASLARRLGDAHRLARAALRYGEVGFGGVYVEAWAFDETKVGLLEEALKALGDEESDLTVRVKARLAPAMYFSPYDSRARREELSAGALEMARRLGDGATLAYALNARHLAVWEPENVEERLALATEIVQLAREAGDRPLELTGRVWRLADALELGRMQEVEREIEGYARVAEELRQPRYLAYVYMFRGMRAIMRGEFDEAEMMAEKLLRLGTRVEDPNAILCYHVQMFYMRYKQGRAAEAVESSRYVRDVVPAGSGAAIEAYANFFGGRELDALAFVLQSAETDYSGIPGGFRLGGLCNLALVVHDAGSVERAGRVYELLLPFAGRVGLAGRDVVVCFGAVSRYLGILADLLGRFEDAERHFEEGLRGNERIGARPFVGFTQHEHARMLLRRRSPGDRERALQLLTRAVATAGALGMKGLLKDALALKLEAQGLSSADMTTSIDAVAAAVQDERPDLRGHAAPDGTVTLMFTDIEGFTPLNERLGDRAAQEILRAHNAVVRRQVALHGGFEVKAVGDGFMIAFGSARRAVACAVGIQRSLAEHNRTSGGEPIRVRIGLHTGEAIVEAGDFYGRHVNLAARIGARAAGGEILLSALTRELTASSGEFTFGPAREVELKGLAGTHLLAPVEWAEL